MYEEEIHFWKLILKQSETVLAHFTLLPLTFDPVTPGWMCGPNMRKVGQGVLELLIGNKKITDGLTYRQTNRPTDMYKAICSLFPKGGL